MKCDLAWSRSTLIYAESVSTISRGAACAAYRVVSQPLHRLCCRAHDLSNGRVGASASRLAGAIAALGAIGVAVHLAGWWGIWGRQGSSCTLYRTLYSRQLAHVGLGGPGGVRRARVRGVSVCTEMFRRWRPKWWGPGVRGAGGAAISTRVCERVVYTGSRSAATACEACEACVDRVWRKS